MTDDHLKSASRPPKDPQSDHFVEIRLPIPGDWPIFGPGPKASGLGHDFLSLRMSLKGQQHLHELDHLPELDQDQPGSIALIKGGTSDVIKMGPLDLGPSTKRGAGGHDFIMGLQELLVQNSTLTAGQGREMLLDTANGLQAVADQLRTFIDHGEIAIIEDAGPHL